MRRSRGSPAIMVSGGGAPAPAAAAPHQQRRRGDVADHLLPGETYHVMVAATDDVLATNDGDVAADDPRFRYEIEFPPALERGLAALALVAGVVWLAATPARNALSRAQEERAEIPDELRLPGQAAVEDDVVSWPAVAMVM